MVNLTGLTATAVADTLVTGKNSLSLLTGEATFLFWVSSAEDDTQTDI
jgi:hypothetical protein